MLRLAEERNVSIVVDQSQFGTKPERDRNARVETYADRRFDALRPCLRISKWGCGPSLGAHAPAQLAATSEPCWTCTITADHRSNAAVKARGTISRRVGLTAPFVQSNKSAWFKDCWPSSERTRCPIALTWKLWPSPLWPRRRPTCARLSIKTSIQCHDRFGSWLRENSDLKTKSACDHY